MRCKDLGHLYQKDDINGEIYLCNGNHGFTHCTIEKEVQGYDGPLQTCKLCTKFRGPRTIGQVFDRVVVINLERRADRKEQVQKELEKGWPFAQPIFMNAIDGEKCPAPNGFTQGNNVWACFQSHRRAVEDAINDGCESLLVLEDDAILCNDFSSLSQKFMSDLPDNWELAFLGGRTEGPTLVKPNVARIRHIDRCHAYAARNLGLRELYRFWHQWHEGHCDWAISNWVASLNSYASVPWLIGQRQGKSDVMRYNGVGDQVQLEERWWHHGPITPVVLPNSRKEQNLLVYPCKYRGNEIETFKKTGGCSVEDSPGFMCLNSNNVHGKASLWRYCTTQAEPACNACTLRELP